MNRDYLKRMTELIDDKFLVEAISESAVNKIRRRRLISVCAAACIIITFASFGGAAIDSEKNGTVDAPAVGRVEIPPITLELPSENVSMDIMGFIYHDGRFYEQGKYVDYSECPEIGDLADKFIGEAKADYGCFKHPEKPVELSSSVTGGIYTVKGYDEKYLLCIPQMYDGCEFMAFFECLNGISFSKGQDIFENKMHLKGGVKSISLYYDNGFNMVEKPLSQDILTHEIIEGFIDELCDSDAVYLSELPTSTEPICIILDKNDGTSFKLLLYENGYVYHVNCYFKLSDRNAFDLIYKICS